MKHLLTAFICILSFTTLSAQTLKGVLKDAKTGEPVPYVNIGLLNKDIGTVSGDDGKFALPVPAGHSADTIRISTLGYKTRDFIVSDLARRLESSNEIKLDEHITELKEVIVSNRKSGTKLLGNKTESKNVTAAFTSNKLGNEVGTVMKIKGTSALLKTFSASIASDNNPGVKMRLNFYNLTKKGMPNELIINENIIVSVPKSSGKLVVDLTPYNIMVEDDFFVSLEWIEDAPDSKRIWFSAALFATPIISRDTSHAQWHKISMAGVGFTVDTVYWK